MPNAMSLEEIASTIVDYGAAAKNAREAGFDGVELHAATTYLLPEFLNSALNIREDAYGGTAENRTRIVLEVLDALIAVWGPGRVGIKISPTLAMGGFKPTDKTIETYDYLVGRLNGLPLSHLQVGRALNDLSGTPVAALQDTIGYYRARFNGTLIANFGFGRCLRQYGDREQAGRSGFLRQTVHQQSRSRATASRGLASRSLIPGDLLPGRTAGICRLPRRPPERDNQQKQTGVEPMTKVTERTIAFVIDASSGIGDRRATAHHQRHNDIRSSPAARRDGASQAI
jgi:hypothetical protein